MVMGSSRCRIMGRFRRRCKNSTVVGGLCKKHADQCKFNECGALSDGPCCETHMCGSHACQNMIAMRGYPYCRWHTCFTPGCKKGNTSKIPNTNMATCDRHRGLCINCWSFTAKLDCKNHCYHCFVLLEKRQEEERKHQEEERRKQSEYDRLQLIESNEELNRKLEDIQWELEQERQRRDIEDR